MTNHESRPWRNRLLIFLVLVAVIGLFVGPIRIAYNSHKQSSRIKMARNFLDAGDYMNAILSARQVLMINPSNVPASVIMAEIADASHSPATLEWRYRVSEAEPTAENKLKLAEAALRYQSRPYPLTSQILDELATTATNLPYYHVVGAEFAMVTRRPDLAHAEWQWALKLAPTNRLYRMNLAAVELSAKDNTKLEAARAELKTFAADTNYAAVALRMLITDQLTHNNLPNAFQLSQQLINLSQASIGDKLQHLTIVKKTSPANYPGQLAALQKSATNAPMVVQVGLWMQANDLSSQALQWVSKLPANVRNQPPVKLIQADLIEIGQDWPALRRFCMRGNWDELDFLRLAFLSRAWSQLGDVSVAKGSWHSAMNAASSRFGSLVGLLELTLRWRLMVERQELFWTLLEKFPRERWVSIALEQQCYKTGDTEGLCKIYEQLIKTYPEDPGIKNNFAYTSLLLKKNQIQAEAVAAKLYSQKPEDPPITSTYAFALHLRGRDAQALAMMQKLKLATLEKPELALHYGLLLQATGRKDEAKKYLTLARTGANLLPEEKVLLGQASPGR